MSKKSRKLPDDKPIEDIQVKLKPILGMSPRIYVPIGWILALGLLVFFIFILPGLRENGSWITVESDPASSSVSINGQRLGPTEVPVFIPRGDWLIEISKSGYQTKTIEYSVKGRIFASYFLPRHDSVEVSLELVDESRLARRGLDEFGAWAATGGVDGNYPVPPVYTQTLRDLATTGNHVLVDHLLLASLPLASEDHLVVDVIRGDLLGRSSGTPLTLWSAVELFASYDRILTERPELLTGIYASFSESAQEVLSVESLSTELETSQENAVELASQIHTSTLGIPRNLGGVVFQAVPPTTLALGDAEVVAAGYNPRYGAVPRTVELGGFYLQNREVTNGDYWGFIQNNPEWAPSNRQNLFEEGLADESYLSNWVEDRPILGTEDSPVVHVSWHAAMAYAQWMDDNFASGTGFVITLPNEDQWEAAARLNGMELTFEQRLASAHSHNPSEKGLLGLGEMAGNVREWCLNPYRINDPYYRTEDGQIAFQDPNSPLVVQDRAIRGGSHIDRSLTVPAAMRGGLPAWRTSPVVGFRLALIPIGD